MPIQFVIPLSLLILVSGWFIGAKTWESHTSATDIEKSLCSKTFQDGKNCPVIVLEPGYSFSKIKKLIPAVVDDIVSEKTNQDQTSNNVRNNSQQTSRTTGVNTTEEDMRTKVVQKLGSLTGSTGLKYEDLKSGEEPTDLAIQKQWMTAIYNYQIKKNVTYQKIIADNGNKSDECNQRIFWVCLSKSGEDNNTSNGVNEKDSELYKKLKHDISAAIKPEQSRGINSPSQSSSRLKPTRN